MPVSLDPSTGLDVATDAVQRAIAAGADAAKVQHGYAERFEVNFDTTDVGLIRSTVSDTMSITLYRGRCGNRSRGLDLRGEMDNRPPRVIPERDVT